MTTELDMSIFSAQKCVPVIVFTTNNNNSSKTNMKIDTLLHYEEKLLI